MKKAILIFLGVIFVSVLVVFGLGKITTNADTASAKQTTADRKDINQASANKTDVAANTSKKVALGGTADITIGSVSGILGSTVIVPISIKTVPEKGIGSCNFNIKYDTEILEVVEVTPGNAIGKNTTNLDYSILDSAGMISFLFTSSNDGKDSITKAGEFINIKFKIKEDAKKGITKITREIAGAFGDTSLNKVDAVFTEGEITVN